MSVEVEGKETVEFQTEAVKKDFTGPIAKAKQARADKKAEKERKRIEAERAREEKRKQSIIAGTIMFLICMIALVMMSINEKSAHEGQLYAPLSSYDASSLKYEDVVNAFEDAGFSNVSTLTIEDREDENADKNGLVEKVTVDGDEYYITDDWYDPDVKVLIYYHKIVADKEEVLVDEGENNSAPVTERKEGRIDEMAFRAAVVALTNSLAADVFDDNDGNAHDPSKYHSYSDLSGEGTMDILSDGYWSELGDNKWHVDSIRLKNKFDVVADASLDVERDGSIYRISK